MSRAGRTAGIGLRARAQRGAFGKTALGRALERALERGARPDRLRAGRTYARSGAVIALDWDGADVIGGVQGSQVDPFAPSWVFDDLDRQHGEGTIFELVDRWHRTPAEHSQILTGTVPEDIAELLLPDSTSVRCACTCPDGESPCAHSMAIAYLLVEAVDDDPTTLLALRGCDPRDILGKRFVAPADDRSTIWTGRRDADGRDVRGVDRPRRTTSGGGASPGGAGSSPTGSATPWANPVTFYRSGPLPPPPRPQERSILEELREAAPRDLARALTLDPQSAVFFLSSLEEIYADLLRRKGGEDRPPHDTAARVGDDPGDQGGAVTDTTTSHAPASDEPAAPPPEETTA